jgi:hypothetical protein
MLNDDSGKIGFTLARSRLHYFMRPDNRTPKHITIHLKSDTLEKLSKDTKVFVIILADYPVLLNVDRDLS